MVFRDESNKIQQVFLCAENKDILEVTTFVEGLILLMSACYVYDVQYPPMYVQSHPVLLTGHILWAGQIHLDLLRRGLQDIMFS